MDPLQPASENEQHLVSNARARSDRIGADFGSGPYNWMDHSYLVQSQSCNISVGTIEKRNNALVELLQENKSFVHNTNEWRDAGLFEERH